jgi:carbonic anhydrase/acetyltransferase-like protein (isoleucine patch superfamily)
LKPIVSDRIRVRHPELFVVGEDSVVDDFCYFSTQVRIGRCTHVASGCSVAGGSEFRFEIGDFSSLSSGVKIWCASDDFVNDLVVLIPEGVEQVKTNLIQGHVSLGSYTAVGANSVVMPDNSIPIGVAIGALSFVPPAFAFEAWTVYAGIPIRSIGPRNRGNVMEQARRLERMLKERDRA